MLLISIELQLINDLEKNVSEQVDAPELLTHTHIHTHTSVCLCFGVYFCRPFQQVEIIWR